MHAFVFNQDLGGKKLSDIKNASEAILLWEDTQSGRNLSGKYAHKQPTSDMTIAGEKREFIKITLDGEFRLEGQKSKRVRIETSSE